MPANFIRGSAPGGGERLWIVDWEYAGMGDPAFDLANFAVNNGLDEAGDDALLEAYGGGDPDTHALMRYMSDLREAMWGVVQQAVSKLDFDFAAYAGEHFARLEATAARAPLSAGARLRTRAAGASTQTRRSFARAKRPASGRIDSASKASHCSSSEA